MVSVEMDKYVDVLHTDCREAHGAAMTASRNQLDDDWFASMYSLFFATNWCSFVVFTDYMRSLNDIDGQNLPHSP